MKIHLMFIIFNIRHQERDKIREYLNKNDILTEIHYPIPPHKQEAMKFMKMSSFPISEIIHRTTLSLPVSFFHTSSEIERVIDVLNAY